MFRSENQRIQPLSSDEQLRIFEEKINYQHNDPAWIQKALHPPNNKQLAMVGAAALRLSLSAQGSDRDASLGKHNVQTDRDILNTDDAGNYRGNRGGPEEEDRERSSSRPRF
jgi:hypothetical protein